MKILMVNKFLYPNGGSETYIFKLGNYLKSEGHEVEYFGMDHPNRIVGNRAESYTSNMDFHTGKLEKLIYPFKIIYSIETRNKIRKVLDRLQPDVVHLNNFNFQLTPSLIYEIKKYEKKSNHSVRIIYTAHDSQLICPNHLMKIPSTRENCERCIGGHYIHCTINKCIHDSVIKSMIGSVEGYLYKALKTYRYIDKIVCPSRFIAEKLNANPLFKDKTTIMHNFIDEVEWKLVDKEDYVLYFGRYSEEKGILTLLEVCKSLPDIKFIFAGSGPLEPRIDEIPNIKNVGFQTGPDLEKLIRKAQFSVHPSECYENCPFSVMESQMYGTPVLGAKIGGIPELIEKGRTGELFLSSNIENLKEKIDLLWNDRKLTNKYSENCKYIEFDVISDYCRKLMLVYAD